MAAPAGNEFWKLRYKHGRDKAFSSPEKLWEAACEYFQWVNDNPLYEKKAFAFQGDVVYATLPKMRAMSLSALCLYIGCNESYLRNFKNQKRKNSEDFSSVIEMIERTVYNQKFEGASADMLNANIIARDLGLIDKQDLKFRGELSDLRLPKYLEKPKK